MVRKWIFLMCLTILMPLHGYEFSPDIMQGMYWQSFPIKMQVVVPTDDGGLLLNLVRECEREWERDLGVDIWDIREATANDQNTIFWEDNFGVATGYNPAQTLALTVRHQQGGFFTKVQIILNGSLSILKQNWSNLLKKTLLHEMGHTIGLDHSTEPAIMQAYIGTYGQLEDDDIQGGNAVIDKQRHYQAIGYISPLAAEDQQMISCGTISFDSGGGSGGGPSSYILSLVMGLLPLLLMSSQGRKLFPTA